MKLPKPIDGFEICPEGMHRAICWEVIDLGSHSFKDGERPKRQIWIGWELVDETLEDGRPFVIGRKYAFSSHKSSNLRKHLEAWRGVPFRDEDFGETGEFDIENLLGGTCQITVEHYTKNDGSAGAKVLSVTKPKQGAARKADPVNDKAYVSLEPSEFDQSAFDRLGEWMQTEIRCSPEWAAMQQSGASETNAVALQTQDDIPF